MKARVGFLALSLSLSACGGGNGGGVPAFTGWSAIQPGSTVAAKGVSQDAAYSYSPVTGKVEAIGGLLVLTDSSANVTLDADGFLSKLVLETPATTLNFDLFADLGDGFIAATNTTFLPAAIIANPDFFGYEYQTFGVWDTDATALNSFTGSFSAGAPTAGWNIPTTSTARFAGNLAGLYVDPDGDAYFAFGEVNVDANFSSQTLAFATDNTYITPDLFSTIARPDLDLSGTLSYAPGTNSFTGNDLISAGGTLTGSTTGQFYGPNAEELGGIFFLRGTTAVESYNGAYGAIQQP